MREKLVVANWKMHGSLSFINDFFAETNKVETGKVCICPPFPYIGYVYNIALDVGFLTGAQDLYFEEKGAYTGEVSATMLSDFNCSYVIIGHSERREMFFEKNEVITKKLMAAAQHGLTPILCVGETQGQRDSGSTLEVINSQLESLLSIPENRKFVIAYEPIWAIGTGNSASADDANYVHAEIRNWLASNIGSEVADSTQVLYGGSVKSGNAKELFAKSDIDGALVGGASLVAKEFMSICNFMS